LFYFSISKKIKNVQIALFESGFQILHLPKSEFYSEPFTGARAHPNTIILFSDQYDITTSCSVHFAPGMQWTFYGHLVVTTDSFFMPFTR